MANVDADSYGVINFTAGNIRVINSDALVAAEDIAENVPEDIPQYIIYTAAEYTARIMGIALACNFLHTFTADIGQNFRYIKIVETVDLIIDDIR